MSLPTPQAHAGLAAPAGSRSTYRARLAQTTADIEAAQALRFQVFNIELNEGLAQSYDSGLDADPFDAVCAHLIVEDELSGAVVGTYRMQTGVQAQRGLGYYSEREFDFAPFEGRRSQMLELGRACIHPHHRSFAVLNLLWTGIIAYAQAHGTRYLLGCSSLTSQVESVGAAAHLQLRRHAAPAAWQTLPRQDFVCALAMPSRDAVQIPRLMSAYLSLGALICGPPAIDREFRTIDFLTWIDVRAPRFMALQRRGRFTA
jgi:putative hemolysin